MGAVDVLFHAPPHVLVVCPLCSALLYGHSASLQEVFAVLLGPSMEKNYNYNSHASGSA